VASLPEGKVVSSRVDLNRMLEELAKHSAMGAGGLALFIGVVKGVVDGRRVRELEYEAYEPHASRALGEIAREEASREKVLDVRVYHRVGRLKPGEPTLYIAVAAVDRKTALEALSRVLERVKHEPPVFKLERREDGEFWVVGDGKRVKRGQGGSS